MNEEVKKEWVIESELERERENRKEDRALQQK